MSFARLQDLPQKESPWFTVHSGEGKPMVAIHRETGDVVIGEGVTPTAAAAEFIAAVKTMWAAPTETKA